MEYTPLQTIGFSSPALDVGFFMSYPEGYQEGYEDAYPEMEVTTYEDDVAEELEESDDIQPQWDEDWN